jgi:hypothetical protein
VIFPVEVVSCSAFRRDFLSAILSGGKLLPSEVERIRSRLIVRRADAGDRAPNANSPRDFGGLRTRSFIVEFADQDFIGRETHAS